jgi:hypothetical protein
MDPNGIPPLSKRYSVRWRLKFVYAVQHRHSYSKTIIFFFILTSDESKIGGEVDSMGYNFIFHEYTQIPMFTRSKRAK